MLIVLGNAATVGAGPPAAARHPLGPGGGDQPGLAGDRIGDRYEQARAHDGLPRRHHATGELDQASQRWRQALALYTDLGVPEADDVHAHLTTLDQATDVNED